MARHRVFRQPAAKDALGREYEGLLRLNFFGDVFASTCVLVVAALMRSEWLGVVGVVRVGIATGVGLGWRSARRGRMHEALRWSVLAHGLGSMLTVAVVPEMIPLSMLVITGDLFMTSFLPYGTQRLRRFSLVMIAACGALYFQDWTRLSNEFSVVWAVLSITLNTMISGLSVPASFRTFYDRILVVNQRLASLDAGVEETVQAERELVADALRTGPQADLAVFEGQVAAARIAARTSRADAGTRLGQLALDVQAAAGRLRDISHGLVWDRPELSIAAAARRFAGRVDVDLYADDALAEVGHEGIAALSGDARAAVVAVIADAVRSLPAGDTLHATWVPHRHRSPGLLRLDARIGAIGLSHNLRTEALLDAVGGERRVVGAGSDAWVEVVIPPPQLSTSEAAVGDVASGGVHGLSARIIDGFTRGQLLIVGTAVLASSLAVVESRRPEALYLPLFLLVFGACIARARRLGRSGRTTAAVGLLAAASAALGPLLVSLVPRFAAMVGLVAVLPSLLTLPETRRSVIVSVPWLSALSLTIVSCLGYLDVPLLDVDVPSAALAVGVSIATFCCGALVVATALEMRRALSVATAGLRDNVLSVLGQARAHRRTIERNLHDGVQQQFVALGMQARRAERLLARDDDRGLDVLAEIDRLLADARDELDLVGQGALHPDLSAGRLASALRRLETMPTGPNQSDRVRVDVVGAEHLDVAVTAAVYLVCSEAVQNASKHAGVDAQIEVSVVERSSSLVFRVTDDGAGFAASAGPAFSGLASMAARVEGLGGGLTVESVPGSGTHVSGFVPLAAPEQA